MSTSKPRLILLYGFAGSGKSTLAKRYIEDHPMAFIIEGDRLIAQIGHWQEHEDAARAAVQDMTVTLGRSYLATGHDVIVPSLPMDARWLETLEAAAVGLGATVHELYLFDTRDEAIRRTYERGTWGEEGAPPLTEADKPQLEQMHAQMVRTVETRPSAKTVHIMHGDIQRTYVAMAAAITSQER